MNEIIEEAEPVQTKNNLDVLLQRVNIARAKSGKTAPKAALYAMLEYIERKHWYGYRRSWEILIEVLADRLGIIAEPWKYAFPGKVRYDHMIEKGWIKQQHTKYPDILKHFEQTGMLEEYLAAAQRDPWDHLGDIFTELELAGRKNGLGQCLTPKGIVDMMIQMVGITTTRKVPSRQDQEWLASEALLYEPHQSQRLRSILNIPPIWTKYVPQIKKQLDPCTGTGRFLIESSLLGPTVPLILFGIEIDVTLYRACLVNMALFSKHPYSIICGDALIIDTNNIALWDRGNLWEPLDISEFYFKPPPVTPTHFSLKGWCQEKTK
jgi:hypothetical protein